MIYLSQLIYVPVVMEDNVVEKIRVNEHTYCIALIKIVCFGYLLFTIYETNNR
jgi:hypothetical protein